MIEEDVNIRFFGIRLSLVLGFIMVIAGGCNLYVYLPLELTGLAYYTSILAYLDLTLFGLYLMLETRMTESKAVYISGLAIGSATVLINICPYPDFLYLLFELIAGAVMVLMAFANLFGYRYNVTRSAYIALILILINIIPMLDEYFSYVSVPEIVEKYYYNFPIIVLYGIYILTLTRKGIWYPSVVKRVSRNLREIEDSTHTGGREFIEPSDVSVFTDPDRSGWEHFDNGPLECETRVQLRGPSRDIQLLIQKWRDEDDLLVTVLPENHGQLSQGYQFRVVRTILSDEGDMVTFYDDSGTFVRIRVQEATRPKGFKDVLGRNRIQSGR